MRVGNVVPMAAVLAAVACGGGGGPVTPTGQTTTPPSVTGLSIAGADALLTATTADYTATASLSNQTTQTVTATWSAGTTTRASVAATGRVTGQSHGSFTLTASYQGMSASRTVQVVNNYDGRWSGVVVRLTCQLNGALGRRITARLCPAGPNERTPMSFTVSQPAPFTQVTAEINLANIILQARGTVSEDGRLLLGGDTEFQQPDPVSQRPQIVRFSILNWDTQVSGPTLGVMGGRFDQNRTESLWEGNVYEGYVIEQMRRPVALNID